MRTDTEKAIEFLEEEINYVDYVAYKTKCIEGVFERRFFEDKRKEVIKLLKNGKKYEMIYNELEGDYRNLPFSVGSCTLHSMRILKDKYFPKPKKTITIEVEADNENELLEFSEKINNYVNYNNDLPNKKWKWKLINGKGG